MDACNFHLSLFEESRRPVTDTIVIPSLDGRYPADRRNIKLTTVQNFYLIEQGLFQLIRSQPFQNGRRTCI